MKAMIKILLMVFVLALLNSCVKDEIIRYKDVELKNTETFQLDLKLSGTDEGARIVKQALHYEFSGFIRSAETNNSIVYRYIPEAGYTGPDRTEIETCTGGNDIRCKNKEKLIITFTIIE